MRAYDPKCADMPEGVRDDIRRAAEILTNAGCTEVYVFGSAVTGRMREDSDIDLAVRGCPRGSFFTLLGKLMWDLQHAVDLVDLDSDDALAQHLQTWEEMVRVA